MILLAVLQAFAYRFDVYSSDDCAYLDQAVFFSKFDCMDGVTGYWSPLYPFVLGMVFKILAPALSDQLFVARMVNVVILGAVLLSFCFFLNQFIRFYERHFASNEANEQPGRLKISETQWHVLGGCLFAWLFFSVGAVNQTTPDYLVAMFMFLSVGIVLQLTKSRAIWQYGLLGMLLGLGYLSKASMIPTAVTLLVLVLVQRMHGGGEVSLSRRLVSIVVAVGVMTLVCCPYVLTLADKKGRFEMSSSAGLNYMISVACKYRPLGPNDASVIKDCPHPIQTLSTTPNVAAFASPVEATFAPWFDPSYFAEGIKVEVDPVASMVSMLTSFLSLFMSFGWQISLAFLVGLAVTKRLKVDREDIKAFAAIWAPAVVTMIGIACVINLSIGWTTQRYFPPMVVLLYLAGFAIANFLDDDRGRKALKLAIGIVCGLSIALLAMRIAGDITRILKPNLDRSNVVASGLRANGLQAGDKVAMIGDESVEWARLADLKIVAQVNSSSDKNDFENEGVLTSVMDKLRQTTATAVVYFPEPFTDYVLDEAHRAQAFRDMISKLTGGKPKAPPGLRIPESSLGDWKKLEGANVYVYNM